MAVAVGVVADTVAALVERITVTRMEVAAVVDDRVVDVKAEEAMVVMEAMVEAAEEDGEDHQAAPGVAATTGGEIKKSPLQLSKEVFNGFGLSRAPQKPNLTSSICVILKAYNFILAPQLS